MWHLFDAWKLQCQTCKLICNVTSILFLYVVCDVNVALCQELLDGLHNDHQEDPWLVHFVNTEDLHDIELRKLPAMLGSIKVFYMLNAL